MVGQSWPEGKETEMQVYVTSVDYLGYVIDARDHKRH